MNDECYEENKSSTKLGRVYFSHPTEFEEVDGGFWDAYGCYQLPDGSFWDTNKVFFDVDGFDARGGFYDEDLIYHPGQNWNEELQCYMDKDIPEEVKLVLAQNMQNKLIEQYDASELAADVEDEEEDDEDLMEIDNDQPMIQSFLEESIIQTGDLTTLNAKLLSSSAKKRKGNENTDPNMPSGSTNGTPFKTKAAIEGQNYESYSVKTVKASPNAKAL